MVLTIVGCFVLGATFTVIFVTTPPNIDSKVMVCRTRWSKHILNLTWGGDLPPKTLPRLQVGPSSLGRAFVDGQLLVLVGRPTNDLRSSTDSY